MYRIHLTSESKGLNFFNDFKNHFLEICQSHHEGDRALCFAFILYRERDAHIPGFLCDRHYWAALNEISGKYLTVFSFMKEEKNPPMEYLTAIRLQNLKPSEASDQILEKYFSIEDKIHYPSILFFQVSKEEIINPFFVQLKEDELEKSFLELKKIFLIVEDTLKMITDENKKNHEEIIALVMSAVEGDKAIEVLKSNVKKVRDIGSFLLPLRHLFGSV